MTFFAFWSLPFFRQDFRPLQNRFRSDFGSQMETKMEPKWTKNALQSGVGEGFSFELVFCLFFLTFSWKVGASFPTSSVRQSSNTGGGEHEKCSISQVLQYQRARCDRHQKASQKTSQNRSKNHQKSISEVIKSRLRKRLASQAPQKRIFSNFRLPKSLKIVQQALPNIEGNHF